MTVEQKKYIKTNLKWPVVGNDIFLRYFILIGPITLTFISISMFYNGFKYGHIYIDNFKNSFFCGAIACLALGIWMTYFTLSRIKRERHFSFLTLNAKISFDNIVEKIQKLNWTTLQANSDTLEFSTKISNFSWGERVTILKVDERSIIINSRPSNNSQPFTINSDKVNYNKLKTILQ
jgi:hypothetical protein